MARRLLPLLLTLPLNFASAAELGGSRASVLRQHSIAVARDLTFLRTPAQIEEFNEKERLELVTSTPHLAVAEGVSYPYARPIVKIFLERLAAQYHEATGYRLVVTSLTRPTSEQPRNASPYSVHPTGIAVDLRVPPTDESREWLESALLGLENQGLIDATRERRPPHYHVAVYPERYEAYVEENFIEEMGAAAGRTLEAAALAVEKFVATPPSAEMRTAMIVALALLGLMAVAPLVMLPIVSRR